MKGKRVCAMHGGKSPGAPKGSKNALRTGMYETISRETLFDEELAFANSVSLDPVNMLEEQIRMLRVKEVRIFKRMKQALIAEKEAGEVYYVKNGEKNEKKIKPSVTHLSVTTVKTTNVDGQKSEVNTIQSEFHSMYYLRLDTAHSQILDQIRRATMNLVQLKAERGEVDVQPASISVQIVDGRVHNEQSAEQPDMPDAE